MSHSTGMRVSTPAGQLTTKYLNESQQSVSMPRISYGDKNQSMVFNAGNVPNTESLIERWSTRRYTQPLSIDDAPESKDARLAWILNCYGHHYARNYGFNPSRCPPIDTWVINRAEAVNTVLTPWFEGMPDNYRLMIHRDPAQPTDGSRPHQASGIWSTVYQNLGIQHGRAVSDQMRSDIGELLMSIHQEYFSADGDPGASIERVGHPFGYSNAVPYRFME